MALLGSLDCLRGDVRLDAGEEIVRRNRAARDVVDAGEHLALGNPVTAIAAHGLGAHADQSPKLSEGERTFVEVGRELHITGIITKLVKDQAKSSPLWRMANLVEIRNDLPMSSGGSALRSARLALKLSMPKLGKLAKTSGQQIDRLEKGQRKLTREWAERLAPHLNITPESLVFADRQGADASTASIETQLRELTPAEHEALGRACVMWMAEKSDPTGAEMVIEALIEVVKRRGGDASLLDLEALRAAVQTVSDLSRSGMLGRSHRNT